MKAAGLALLLMATQDAPVAEPAWMAGTWIETRGDGWAEEFWTHPRGGMMLGSARTGKGEQLTGWEAMRIVRGADGTLSFVAQPGGKPPSSFPMISSGHREIVFANAAHDYPQKIRYWRDDTGLNAEISLIDGSKAPSSRWGSNPDPTPFVLSLSKDRPFSALAKKGRASTSSARTGKGGCRRRVNQPVRPTRSGPFR